MNNLKLLFKNKIAIIIAAVLVVTLLISATFVSTYAKYVKSQNVTLNLTVKSGVPSLSKGPTDYNNSYIRDGIYQSIIKVDNSYGGSTGTLNAVKSFNIIETPTDPNELAKLGVLVEANSDLLTDNGVVDIYWNKETGVFTICSTQPIYANKNCSQMFEGMAGMTSVDFSNLHTDNTAQFNGMFYNCSSLTGFSFKDLNTQKAANISGMFSGCKTITSAGFGSEYDVDFTGLVTENLSGGYNNLFQECTSLKKVDLTGFKSTTQDKYNRVFYGCTSLTDIDFGETFFCSSGNDFGGMFYGCTSLETIDLSTFNKEKAGGVYFYDMFRECKSLKSLDLTKFNTSNVSRLDGMFRDCSNLATIDFGDNFTTAYALYINSMFEGCSSLTSLGKLQLHLTRVQGNTLYYEYGLCNLFKGCAKLENIEFLTPYKSASTNVYTAKSMFEGCESLTTIDLTGFATEDFKTVDNMFSGCKNLTRIICVDADDTQKFTLANATHAAGLFNGCEKLVSLADDFVLDLSNISTAKYVSTVVGSTENMFNGCSSLTELNFEAGITSNVTDVSGMFNGCIGLTNHTIDLTGFDFTGVNVTTGAVNSYDNLFAGYGSSSLTVKRPTGTWLTKLETTPGGAVWAGVTFN